MPGITRGMVRGNGGGGTPGPGPSPDVLEMAGTPPTGRVGVAYSYQMVASGGVPPYTYSISSGALPDGVTFNASTGLLSGNPTTMAKTTGNIGLRVTDAAATVVTLTRAWQILPAADLSFSGAPPQGQVGQAYSFNYTVAGGYTPRAFTVTAGSLPPGISLNASTGALTGTPTGTGGDYSFTVTCTEDSGTGPAAIGVASSVTILASDLVASGSPPGGTIGLAYSWTPSVTGGSGTKVWSIAVGALPSGLSLNTSTGAITGTPTVAGPFNNFTLRVTDGQTPTPDTSDLACNIVVIEADEELVISGTPPDAIEGEAYNWQATVVGGSPPYTLTLQSGTLPTGLTIDAADCSINGTPTTVETDSFVLRVTDALSATDDLSTSIEVLDNGAVDGSDAPLNAAKTPSGMTLSDSDFVFTKTTAVGAFIGLAGHKTSNRYWVEFEGEVATGVEYCGIGVVNTLYDATSQPGDSPNQTRGKQLYEESTRGTWAEYYNGSGGTNHVLGAGGAMNTGGVVGAEYDNDARKFYPFIHPAGGSFQWIAGNPNTNPELGVAYQMSGDAAPCVGAYYDNCQFRVRTAAECTEQANRRSGTTVGWKDSTPADPPVLNIYGDAPDGVEADAYTFTPTTVGGNDPYTYAITAGALPAGLSLNASTGAVTGTPTVQGYYTFTITVTDDDAATDTLVSYMFVDAEGVDPPDGDFLYSQSKAVFNPDYSDIPAKGEQIIDANTGATVKRVTAAATDTGFTSGALTVYSRFSSISSDGQYVLIHGENSTSSWVIRRSDGAVVRASLMTAASQTLGEVNEVRWDYTGTFPTRVYYVYNMAFYYMDVLTGVSTLIRNFAADFPGGGGVPAGDYIANDVEGDCSNDNDLWCWMVMYRAPSGPYYPVAIFAYRVSTNTIVGTVNSGTSGYLLGSDSGSGTGKMTRPNMVEALPDGTGVVIHWARTYAGNNNNLTGTHQDGPHKYGLTMAAAGAIKVAVDATHSGWARIGSTWYFVSQNNRNDWIEACDLTNGFREDGVNVLRMINHGDLGWNNGFHFGKMYTKAGWAFMSTYANIETQWGNNQLIMLKVEANCEVLRCTPTYNEYPGNDAYRNEAAAALDVSGNVMTWTSNFGENFDRREVLEFELPDDWETVV